MEDVKIRAFLQCDGSGSGYGSGYGDGSGYGSGYGDGSGYGSGYGYGSGSGSGYGSGYGDGSGYGSGYGDGDGSCGLFEINGHTVYMVDSTPTIFTAIHGNVAKGFILQSDLTMTPCYIVKGNNLFAHGSDLHEAMQALTDKMFEDMPEDERIAEFVKAHPEAHKAYPNKELFDWHNKLTGSCMAGRTAFVKDRGLSLDGKTTVAEFIKLTENAYGGSTIKKLKEKYAGGTP